MLRPLVLPALLVALLASCLAPPLQAQDSLDESIAKVNELKEEVQQILVESMQGFSPELSQEEQDKMMRESLKIREEKMTPKLNEVLELLLPFAEDEEVIEELSWIINNNPGSPAATKSAELMMEHHATNPALIDIASRFQYAPMPWTVPMLEGLAKAELTDANKVRAMLALAQCHKALSTFPALIADLPENQQSVIRMNFGDDFIDQIAKIDSAESEATALKLYEQIRSEFPDQEYFGRPVADVVDGAIFELKNLVVGKEAPDIVGEDIDGVDFKLSDYRGKVVMLDFWGDW